MLILGAPLASGSCQLLGESFVENKLVDADLGDVDAERGFELRDGVGCGADADSVVLLFVVDASAFVIFGAHELFI